MPAQPDTILVTREEVIEHAQASQDLLKDDVWQDRAIRAVQKRLAAYLGYAPFIHAATQDVLVGDTLAFKTSAATTYFIYANDRPVVEIVTSGPAAHADGNRITYTTSFGASVSYFAGWKRADQTLAVIQTLDDLDTLTATPPDVPDDIAAALCEGVILLANRVASNTIGLAQTVQKIGSGSVVTTSSAFNDVNTLIGRGTELDAIFRQYCWNYRRAGGLV